MPDAIDIRRAEGVPNDWGQAFAQLAPETPPADARLRFEQALQARARQAAAPRRDRRGTWAVGLASAAVLALVIGAPLLQRPTSAPRVQEAAVATPTPPTGTAARTAAAAPADSAIAARVDGDAPRSTDLRLVQRALPGLERTWPERSVLEAPSPAVDRLRARQATDRLVAALALPAGTSTLAQVPDEALQRLEAQSQQLEALVALARDERVGSGASVAMTGELDAALAQLDAQLQEPGLPPSRRVALWQQRVDLLEHLAGVASTQRWLAAQGAMGETALVSVD